MAFTEIFPKFFCHIEDITAFGMEHDGYYVHLKGTKVRVPTSKEWDKVTALLTKMDIIELDASVECAGCAVRDYCFNKKYGSPKCCDLRTVSLVKADILKDCIRCVGWVDCTKEETDAGPCDKFSSIHKV